MRRYLMISSDTHANPTTEQYRACLDPEHREAYDAFADATVRSRGVAHVFNVGGTEIDPFGVSVRAQWDKAMQESQTSAASSQAEVRMPELDREGVVGEVIFPVSQAPGEAPLLAGLSPAVGQTHALVVAGARAYNRWLADFCRQNRARSAGVAVMPPLTDVAAVVEEIRWAAKAGLRGGIMLSAMSLTNTDPELFLSHPRFEPVWAACEDLNMPLNCHVGAMPLDYGGSQGALWIYAHDNAAANHRAFWFLLWSGVFERHPRLKWVITENGGTWAVFALQRAEAAYEHRNPEAARAILPMRPSEYWARQCFVGASPPSGRGEVEARAILGTQNIMWGSDYPHREGTWPMTRQRLHNMFSGIPEAEVRDMVGLNAARVYGFDVAELEPVAQRIGPRPEEFESDLVQAPVTS